jgi:hypothetical protein
MRYPHVAARWHLQSNHLVFLSVLDLAALQGLLDRMRVAGLLCAAFYEPDIGDALTAFAVEPSPLVRKYCGGLPLCLKECNSPVSGLPASNSLIPISLVPNSLTSIFQFLKT